MDNLDKLKKCFKTVFNSSEVENMSYRETPLWDSVGQITLIASIEDAFDILFEPEEMMEGHTFNKIKEILEQNHGVIF